MTFAIVLLSSLISFRFLRLTFSQTIALSIAFIGFVKYLGFLINFLHIADVIIIITILGVSAYSIKSYANFKPFEINAFSLGYSSGLPGLVFDLFLSIVVISIVIVFNDVDLKFSRWDEFSHWGTSLKLLHQYGSKEKYFELLHAPDYIPGFTLSAEFFLDNNRAFEEWHAFRSYNFIKIVFLLAIVSTIIQYNLIGAICFLPLFLWVLSEYDFKLNSVLVDPVLGILLAYSFVLIVFERNNVFRHVSILFMVILIGVTKSSGAYLGLVIAGVYFVAELIKIYPMKTKFSLMMVFAFSISMFLAPFVIKSTWNEALTRGEINLKPIVSVSPSTNASKFVSCCNTEREISTTNNFVSRLFTGKAVDDGQVENILGVLLNNLPNIKIISEGLKYSFTFTGIVLITFAVGMLCGIFVLIKSNVKNSLSFFSMHFVVLFGFIAYLASLLGVYLYTFTEYEGTRLASFDRYIELYIMGYLFASIAMLVKALSYITNSTIRNSVFFVIAVFSVQLYNDHTQVTKIILNENRPDRIEVSEWIENWPDDIKGQHNKYYVNYPESNGYQYWVMRFELLSEGVNRSCFNVRLDGSSGNYQTWSCVQSIDAFQQTLKKYDYLVVGKSNDLFMKEYGSLVRGDGSMNGNKHVYRVQIDANKKVYLEGVYGT